MAWSEMLNFFNNIAVSAECLENSKNQNIASLDELVAIIIIHNQFKV